MVDLGREIIGKSGAQKLTAFAVKFDVLTFDTSTSIVA